MLLRGLACSKVSLMGFKMWNLRRFFLLFFCVFGIKCELLNIQLLTENEIETEDILMKEGMPDTLVFKITRTNGHHAVLRLSKIAPLTTTAVTSEGARHVPADTLTLASYSDYSTKAVLLINKIKKEDNTIYSMEGHFQLGRRLIHMKPTEDKTGHIIIHEEILRSSRTDPHHRSARALKLYTVETLLIADYENFYTFLTRNNNDITVAEAEMTNYYAFVAQKMNVRYHSINEVDGTIAFEVVSSGLVIIEDRASSWFSEDIKNGSLVEATVMLNLTERWFKNPPAGIILPDSDHYMFFTGYNLVHAENLGNAGYAYTAVVCIPELYGLGASTSIVEDHRDGETGVTASHELGHALSAQHDTQVGCSDSDGYIMSGQPVLITELARARRPWQFSSCSVEQFKKFVERPDVNCLHDNRYGNGAVSSNQLPGEYFRVDQQCVMKYGNGSRLCEFPYANDLDKLCYILYCELPSKLGSCGSARVMEYTSCDSNRWCYRGLCVRDSNAPPVFRGLPTESVGVPSNMQGVILTLETFDPDTGDTLTFHPTWDPAAVGDFFDFNQETSSITVKQDLDAGSFPVTNFSLIVSVDDGIILSQPVNINFHITDPLPIDPTRAPLSGTTPKGNSTDDGGGGGDETQGGTVLEDWLIAVIVICVLIYVYIIIIVVIITMRHHYTSSFYKIDDSHHSMPISESRIHIVSVDSLASNEDISQTPGRTDSGTTKRTASPSPRTRKAPYIVPIESNLETVEVKGVKQNTNYKNNQLPTNGSVVTSVDTTQSDGSRINSGISSASATRMSHLAARPMITPMFPTPRQKSPVPKENNGTQSTSKARATTSSSVPPSSRTRKKSPYMTGPLTIPVYPTTTKTTTTKTVKK